MSRMKKERRRKRREGLIARGEKSLKGRNMINVQGRSLFPSFVRVLDSQSDTLRPSTTIVQRERGRRDISQKGPPEGDPLSVNGRQGCVHSYNIASLSLFLSFSLSLSLSAIYLQTKYGQNRPFFYKKVHTSYTQCYIFEGPIFHEICTRFTDRRWKAWEDKKRKKALTFRKIKSMIEF